MSNVFSGGISLERVNPLGLVLMLLSVVCLIAAPSIAKRRPEEQRTRAEMLIRILAILVCCAGALIAIL